MIRSVRNVVDQLLHVQIVHQVKNLYQDNVHYVLRIASNVMALLNVKHVTKALWQWPQGIAEDVLFIVQVVTQQI